MITVQTIYICYTNRRIYGRLYGLTAFMECVTSVQCFMLKIKIKHLMKHAVDLCIVLGKTF